MEQLFCVYLAQLIFTKDKIHSPKVWSYKPSELDETSKSDLKTQVNIALEHPTHTVAYQYAKSENKVEENQLNALLYVELAGLLVLLALGEKKVIPILLQLIKTNYSNIRARTITSSFLYYATGQNIGSYFLNEEDINLWEEWWEQNK